MSHTIDKLITIGTPNHGIWDSDGWNWGCSAFHQGDECSDMQHDSTFISQLNQIKVPITIKVMTIAGFCGKSSKTDAEYDEVIRVNSVRLEGAENFEYEFYGEYEDDTLHTDMVYPSRHPDVYAKIVESLNLFISMLQKMEILIR